MNEPAFPSNGYVASSLGDLTTSEKGMTLRDYFAAKAMQAIIAMRQENQNGDFVSKNDGLMQSRYALNYVAQTSYEMADAMMQARLKNGGKDESTSAG